MRDDRAKWRPAAVHPGLHAEHQLQAQGLVLRRIVPMRQMLVSGPRAAALAFCGAAQAIGWPDIAATSGAAISLRRDRILAVDGPDLRTGWLDDLGLAVSDVTDGFEVVELEGPRALAFLKTGTELSLDAPSASAQRLWHGYTTILYRADHARTYRLHVPAAQGDGFWALLAAQLDGLPHGQGSSRWENCQK